MRTPSQTAVLSQFQRASSNTGGASVKGRARRPVNLLRTIATVSLILLIAGYSSYDGFAPSADGSSQPLPSSAKAGSILFVVTTVGETALLLYSFLNASSELKNRGDHEARLIVKLLLAAQPFLLVRIVYSTYLVVSDHPFSGNVSALEPTDSRFCDRTLTRQTHSPHSHTPVSCASTSQNASLRPS